MNYGFLWDSYFAGMGLARVESESMLLVRLYKTSNYF
jgi:hypothetical protein